MPRKHKDGRLLDDQGNVIGRWDDNVHGIRQWAISHNEDPDKAEAAWRQGGQSHRPVVKRVEGYYEANKHRDDRGYGMNWLRVLVAFGQYRERGIKPYSAAEAWESAKVWGGWKEVAQALEGLESGNFEFAHGYDPAGSVYQQDGTDGYVAPDDERWGNERQADEAESPDDGLVWYGRITQGTYPDGRYIAIGTEDDFEEAILYLLMEWQGKPQGFVRQNTPTKGPARVHHTRSWNQVDIKRTDPVKRPLSEIEAEFGTRSWIGCDRPVPQFGAAPASQIAPEHVDRFCEYLERERDFMAYELGQGHPAVKNKELDSYIADVKAGGRLHSQIMFQYEQFLGWLRGEHGQRVVRGGGEITLYADGSEIDHTKLSAEEAAYKAQQDAHAEEVKRFQELRDSGDPDAQQGFDEWKRLQTDSGKLFAYNGVYVEDTRAGCTIPSDHVARRRGELTAENVRYRLSVPPTRIPQISWLALNYEGCLAILPRNSETQTRMVPAEEIQDLLAGGLKLLSEEEYADNQRRLFAKDDKLVAYGLWVQLHPKTADHLGVCPKQGDSSDGKWKHNAELFARLQGQAAEETAPVDAPADMAAAIQAGDWAEVARLAAAKAGQ